MESSSSAAVYWSAVRIFSIGKPGASAHRNRGGRPRLVVAGRGLLDSPSASSRRPIACRTSMGMSPHRSLPYRLDRRDRAARHVRRQRYCMPLLTCCATAALRRNRSSSTCRQAVDLPLPYAGGQWQVEDPANLAAQDGRGRDCAARPHRGVTLGVYGTHTRRRPPAAARAGARTGAGGGRPRPRRPHLTSQPSPS